MRKSTIRHEYLRKCINDVMNLSEEELDEEILERFSKELKYSCLIAAGNVVGDTFNLMTAQSDIGDFGMLFTDMDEFAKVFPDPEIEAHEHLFARYKKMLELSDLKGFVVNFASEAYVLPRGACEMVGDVSKSLFSTDASYSLDELKKLKGSIDNTELELFIKNPENAYRYEELFDIIADSVLFTLLVSNDNLDDKAENGAIAMDNEIFESAPLYIANKNGRYAAVFTSEEKIENIKTKGYRYYQIVNFAHLFAFALADGLDGIIINPNSDYMAIGRDVLLEFCDVIENKCCSERLNSGMDYMYPMGEAR